MVKFIFALIIGFSFAHKHHDHRPNESDKNQMTVTLIAEAYKQNIEKIFSQKCLDCHGGPTKYPWYYKIPGVKQLIDSDIAEASEHLDFSKGFPFKSHGTTKEDLDAIHEEISEDEMPPFRYVILHRNSRLTREEKETVIKWAKDSLELLK